MGTLDKLPEHWKSQKTADAVMAPSAIVLGGAGAAAAILGGLPVLAIAGIAALVYGIRVAMLLPRKQRGSRIDPMSIADPWRSFMREALDAQRRYRKAVSASNEGPMRDRLVEIGGRVDAGVEECWRIARRGDALQEAIANLDVPNARAELEQAKQESRDDRNDATVQSLQAQVDSADRIIEVARDAQDKLRLLDARLDEAVARAVELSIQAEDVADLGGLGGQVDEVVSDMETLRVSLEEAGGTARAAGASS